MYACERIESERDLDALSPCASHYVDHYGRKERERG